MTEQPSTPAAPQPRIGPELAVHRPRIRAHILAMVRDPAEAEDLTQDAYARALPRLHQLRDPQAGLAWLYRIATTVTLDALRRRTPAVLPLDHPAARRKHHGDPSSSPVEAGLERAEMSGCVQQHLDRLTAAQRTVLLLHDTAGLTSPQIARLLGCTPGAVKASLHRARRRLRDTLGAACRITADDRGVIVCEPADGGSAGGR